MLMLALFWRHGQPRLAASPRLLAPTHARGTAGLARGASALAPSRIEPINRLCGPETCVVSAAYSLVIVLLVLVHVATTKYYYYVVAGLLVKLCVCKQTVGTYSCAYSTYMCKHMYYSSTYQLLKYYYSIVPRVYTSTLWTSKVLCWYRVRVRTYYE